MEFLKKITQPIVDNIGLIIIIVVALFFVNKISDWLFGSSYEDIKKELEPWTVDISRKVEIGVADIRNFVQNEFYKSSVSSAGITVTVPEDIIKKLYPSDQIKVVNNNDGTQSLVIQPPEGVKPDDIKSIMVNQVISTTPVNIAASTDATVIIDLSNNLKEIIKEYKNEIPTFPIGSTNNIPNNKSIMFSRATD